MDVRDLQHPSDLDWTRVAYPVAVEPKIDGCRCLAAVDSTGTVRATSRLGTEWTAIIPALSDLARFPGVAFDGEIVVGGAWGRTNGAIHRRVLSTSDLAAVQFHAFDLPDHPGTYTERRAALAALIAMLPVGSRVTMTPEVLCPDRAAVEAEFARVVGAGGEGIVVKRLADRYTAGRTGSWGKLKPQPTMDVFKDGRCLEMLNGRVHRVRHDRAPISAS